MEIHGLVKAFGATTAVDRLDLAVTQGELFALLGPNGAGKTTMLRIVAGLLRPDAGTVAVMGHDIATDPLAAKRHLAFLPEEPLLYGKLTPIEYLEFVAGLWRVEAEFAAAKAVELLEWLGLGAKQHERIETLSRGMRQKLALAGGLIHDPEVMILDEPLTGLDAAAARQIKDLLLARAASGKTVILTTHILEVAEQLAERIAIIDGGRLVAAGTLAELRALSPHIHAPTLEAVYLELTAAPAEPPA